LEEFALLGNAAAVPIIIGTTQLLKKNFSFKYKSDVVSFVVSLIICPLWWFYNTPEAQVIDMFDDGVVATVKFIIELFLISVATYMTASKSYDMFSGNKKRDVKHTTEKDELQEKINELELNLENGGNPTDESNEEIEIRDKLLEILGERN
jgi:hypothetical protein